MENIRRLTWAGAALALAYAISGVIVAIIAGLEPVLILACIFSAIGAWAAIRGTRNSDLAWWSGGILITGFITPTTWGLIPMIVAVLLVITGSVLTWHEHRRGSL